MHAFRNFIVSVTRIRSIQWLLFALPPPSHGPSPSQPMVEPSQRTIDELLADHALLPSMCPPASFVVDPTAPLLMDLLNKDWRTSYRTAGRSPCHDIGVALGGVGENHDRRWSFLADPKRLELVGKTVYQEHLQPAGEGDASLIRSGELCLPNENRSLLAPGTARWNTLRAVAQLFVRQPDESEREHFARCQRWDAWAVSNLRARPAVAVALLWTMTKVLEEEPQTDADGSSSSSSSTSSGTRTVLAREDIEDFEEALIASVHRVRLREPQLSAKEVCSKVNAVGFSCTEGEVKKALSKAAKRSAREEGARPPYKAEDAKAGRVTERRRAHDGHSDEAARAVADAVSIHDAEMATWMRENDVQTPTAYEAARLTRLTERLVVQKSEGDIEGGVDTWLEIWLDEGARPTRQERKLAHLNVTNFFHGDPSLSPLEALHRATQSG